MSTARQRSRKKSERNYVQSARSCDRISSWRLLYFCVHEKKSFSNVNNVYLPCFALQWDNRLWIIAAAVDAAELQRPRGSYFWWVSFLRPTIPFTFSSPKGGWRAQTKVSSTNMRFNFIQSWRFTSQCIYMPTFRCIPVHHVSPWSHLHWWVGVQWIHTKSLSAPPSTIKCNCNSRAWKSTFDPSAYSLALYLHLP